MSEMKMTGERFLPEMEDAELELEHMERYYAASRFTEGKIVLDAASGEGYGCYLLARKARKVIGIDLDAEAVAHAKEKYADADNLVFVQSSVDKMDMIQDHSIDVVTSFETIEHVPESAQRAFISEIYRVLRQDGILIMSSPNKKEYSDRYHFQNPFHIHELYVDEFISLLKETFEHIRLYQQYLEVVSLIDQEGVDVEKVLYRKDSSRYEPKGKYVIALAGNAELPEKTLSMVNLHLREEYLPLLENLHRQRTLTENACNEKKASEQEYKVHIEQLKQEHKRHVLELEGELTRRADELEHRMDVINRAQEEISILNNEWKLCREELDRRAVELEHRMQVINELEAYIGRSNKQKIKDYLSKRIKHKK